MHKPHSVIYIYTYIYMELCKYKCVYSDMLTHTHICINIYMYIYIYIKKMMAKWLNREILS